jgi:hypothetical protein
LLGFAIAPVAALVALALIAWVALIASQPAIAWLLPSVPSRQK